MQKNQQKQSRERFLNIIYFIDSNKTKTFKFNLNYSYMAIGFLAATVLWSIISTVLLLSAYERSDFQSQRVRSLLATIFNYQTRYDEVYERTYPNDKGIPKQLPKLSDYDSESETLRTNKTPPKSKIQESDDKSVSLAAKPISGEMQAVGRPKNAPPEKAPAGPNAAPSNISSTMPTKEEAALPPDPQAQAQALPNKTVKLDKFKVSQKDNALALDFAIKNLIRPNRAIGYVIGYAKYIGTDGSLTTISSPRGMLTKEKIVHSRLPRGHRFSIRYYTQKSLVFDVPNKKGGTFDSIKIIVGGKNIEPMEIVYTIKGSEGAFAPALETTPKTNDESNSQQNTSPDP